MLKDITIHDLDKHLMGEGEDYDTSREKLFNADGTSKRGHGREWYAFWNSKRLACPTCDAVAEFEEIDDGKDIS